MLFKRISVLRHLTTLSLVLGSFSLALAAFGGVFQLNQRSSIRIAIDRVRLEPAPLKALNLISSGVADLLHAGLYRVLADGRVDLAMAKQVRSSQDQRTWTFWLRDWSWSDGTPVVASDFVRCWVAAHERAVAGRGPSPYESLDWSGPTPPIWAEDDRTLCLRWSRPRPQPANDLVKPPFHLWREGAATSGRFQMLARVPGCSIYLVPRADLGLANCPVIELVTLDQRAAFAAARAHQIDWIGSPWGASQMMLSRAPEGEWRRQASWGCLWARMNARAGRLDQIDARARLANCLDLAAREMSGIQTDDPRGAGFLFAVEGPPVQDRGDVLDKPLDLILLSDPVRLAQAAILQAKLQPHGYRMQLRPLEAKAFFESVARGDYDLCLSSWFAESPAPDELLRPWGGIHAPGNCSGVADERITALVEQFAEEGNRGALQKAARLVKSLAVVVPVAPLRMVSWASERGQMLQFNPLGGFDAEASWPHLPGPCRARAQES